MNDSPKGFTELYAARIGMPAIAGLLNTNPYFGVFTRESDGRLFYGPYVYGAPHLASHFTELTAANVVEFAMTAQKWGQVFENQNTMRGGRPGELKSVINALISNTLLHMVDQTERNARSHEEKVLEAKAEIRRIRCERHELSKELDQLSLKLAKNADQLNEARNRYNELT